MKRNAETFLSIWKSNPERYPLIIRGARQTGKTYLIENFGKRFYEKVISINFEYQPQLKQCFNTLNPQEIINKIQLLMNVMINEETLLFFDEIQDCPEAIMSLRYFKEKMPNIPIIGAGSLLEFALINEKFKMPVGRVDFMYLEPLSFDEYLEVTGNGFIKDYLKTVTLSAPPDNIAHEKLTTLLKEYFVIGGMPAVVDSYIKNKNMNTCQRLQSGLIQSFRSDFGKYAKISQHKHLQQTFNAIPGLVGKQIKYSAIDSLSKSRDIKTALDLLTLAKIITPVYATSASGLPLDAQIKPKKFKVNFLDIGLMQQATGTSAETLLNKDILQINSGSVAEQFVGQQLRNLQPIFDQHKLFYWCRENKNSSAEVDYVVAIDDKILPIEVKAGSTGKLKSLRIYLEEKNIDYGIRISLDSLSFYDQILTVPMYMIHEIPRLIKLKDSL